MASWNMGVASCHKTMSFEVSCSRKRDRDRERGSIYPYKVVEITPPPKCLGVRCLPPEVHVGPLQVRTCSSGNNARTFYHVGSETSMH
ncbi:hypothetical protein ACSQ67_016634 [Phaseolus vulgaris]